MIWPAFRESTTSRCQSVDYTPAGNDNMNCAPGNCGGGAVAGSTGGSTGGCTMPMMPEGTPNGAVTPTDGATTPNFKEHEEWSCEVELLKSAMMFAYEDVFVSQTVMDYQCEALGWSKGVDGKMIEMNEARREMTRILSKLQKDCRVKMISVNLDSEAGGVSMDSIFLRDMLIFTSCGTIACRMDCNIDRALNAIRMQNTLFSKYDISRIGQVQAPGLLCGSDFVCVRANKLAWVRPSKDTNAEGIEQLKKMLPGSVELIVLPPLSEEDLKMFGSRRPYMRSYLTPVGEDMVLGCREFLPDDFVSKMTEAGLKFIWCPVEEMKNGGCEIICLSRQAVLIGSGLPKTTQALHDVSKRVVTVESPATIGKCGDGWLGSIVCPVERQRAGQGGKLTPSTHSPSPSPRGI